VVTLRRLLLAIPALLLTFGGVTHLSAFHLASDAVAASNLPPFFGNSLKALWVMDSCGMFVLAAVCVVLVVRQQAASRAVIALLSLLPLSTAALLYMFIGVDFFAGHLLVAAGASLVAAALAD